jgi:hypothetical protein
MFLIPAFRIQRTPIFELRIYAVSLYIFESKFSEDSKLQATGFSTPIYKPELKFRSRKILKLSLIWWLTNG